MARNVVVDSSIASLDITADGRRTAVPEGAEGRALADVMAERGQLIEASVAEPVSDIAVDTLQLPQQLNENLGVALVDLVKQFIGINAVDAVAGFDEQRARHLGRAGGCEERLHQDHAILL